MKHLCLSLAVIASLLSFSQNKAIAAGEKLVFNASYNISGLLTEIAQVTMETSEVHTSKNTLLHLRCTAVTYKKWDNFFKIRDLYESYVNPKTLTPYLHKRDISEGGYTKFMQYTYEHKTKQVKSIKRKKQKDESYLDEIKTLNVDASTKDVVSTIYQLRSFDIHKANPGDKQQLTILFDNIERIVTVRYIKKETISTKLGVKECYKLAISLKGSQLLKDDNSNLIWLTADENKIPVLIKFKIPIGNGEIKIDSATGLKN